MDCIKCGEKEYKLTTKEQCESCENEEKALLVNNEEGFKTYPLTITKEFKSPLGYRGVYKYNEGKGLEEGSIAIFGLTANRGIIFINNENLIEYRNLINKVIEDIAENGRM